MLTPAVSALQRQPRDSPLLSDFSGPGLPASAARAPFRHQGARPSPKTRASCLSCQGTQVETLQPLPQDPASHFQPGYCFIPHLLHSPGSGGRRQDTCSWKD